MLRATIKSLLARKLRLLLTALAVVLGVGFTAGTFILTDIALKSFDDLFGNVYNGTAVVVQPQTAFKQSAESNGTGNVGTPIPESVLPKVQAVDGVAAADGSVSSQSAQIIDPTTGEFIHSGGAPSIGTSFDPDVTQLVLVDGAAPT